MLEKTYTPADVETRLYQTWRESGVFAGNPESAAPPYSIMMPPPNVTGSLHMGHAFTYTLPDMLIRYNRLRGRDALWQPGMDHAGIATQMVVERQLAKEGLTRHDLGREPFIDRVWQWKAESGGTILGQMTRLGLSADWDRERFTMDEGLSHAVRTVFVTLYKQNLIYRDKRLVNWDPHLHTAISDLEVEQKEVDGHMWYFRYPVEGNENTYVTVGTTRPETMLGDTAVAVHPDDERYTGLVGRHCVLPLVGRRIPIVADAYADPEKGSGAVKITPAHDFNDFEVGRRHGLEMINILDHNACLNDNVPEAYGGLDRYEARKKVVAALEAEGLLERVESLRMMVPYGDRSGVVIEPWLTDQWFVDAATLARPCIEAVEQGRTRFVPQRWENVYFEWMRNIQPWCISRQIWWGHRIPVWYGPDGHFFVEMSEEEALVAARSHYGTDQVTLTQDTDVLDTWFSSALWPFSTLGWPEKTPELARYYPTDVMVTGFDIIFFWVARMMMMGLHFMEDVPFRTVYIHALVRDEKGQKMSKSKGNIIDPLEMVERYGADALRFTLVAMAAQGRDVKMSESRVEGYRNFGTKLWNAARFCQMNACHTDPAFDPATVCTTLNRWIVGKAAQTVARVNEAMEGYRFNDAAAALYQFTWNMFCDWYLEFAKPVFQDGAPEIQRETRATTAWVRDVILHLLHPMMPFITEELWQKTEESRPGMLIASDWPDVPDSVVEAGAEAEMDWVLALISAIRTVRAEMNVPPSARLTATLKDAAPVTRERLQAHDSLIRSVARLDALDAANGEVPVHGAAQVVVGEATVVLPLAGVIDLNKERLRLEKDIARLETDIAKVDKKLENENFLSRAPEEVIAEQRERRADFAAQRHRLKEALSRLG